MFQLCLVCVSMVCLCGVCFAQDNTEMISKPVTDFQFTYWSRWSMPPFSREDPPFLDYHYKVFRAAGTSAHLTIADWASEADPGGPIGQELMFGFIEVQPYLG